jgi:hypothetical protein
MFANFYNQSIRKLVIVFGNLFNEIYIRKSRENDVIEKIRVPLTYSPKEKFYRRLREPSSITDTTKNQITLPRLSFAMTEIAYDTSRKLNKTNARTIQTPSGEKLSVKQVVPYGFNFELVSYTKNIDDNLQIMEQILPYFAPELVVKIRFNQVFESVDVPITLTSVANSEDYEGTFEERRMLMCNYNFTVRSYVYGPVTDPKVIEETNFGNINFLE